MERVIDITDPAQAEQDVHHHIGAQLKQLRKMIGFSQEDLAKEILVTFQQYQKYENATNRITPGKLWLLAQALQVPISSLFPVNKIEDYEPAPPRQLQIMKLASRIIVHHSEEMSLIIRALSRICEKKSHGEEKADV